MVFLKEFFGKVDFEKNKQTTKKKSMKNYPGGKKICTQGVLNEYQFLMSGAIALLIDMDATFE